MHEIQRMTRKAAPGASDRDIPRADRHRRRGSARTALRRTGKARGKDLITDLAIAETRKEIEHFCGLGARVIDQSRRRVLCGEQVPTVEKLYSIFELYTDLIKRGKVQTFESLPATNATILHASLRSPAIKYARWDGRGKFFHVNSGYRTTAPGVEPTLRSYSAAHDDPDAVRPYVLPGSAPPLP
jgi:hypothetical protein